MQSLHLIEMIKWRDFNELMQFLIHFTTSRRPSWSPTRWPRYASQPFQTEAYRWWHQRGESWAGQQKSSEIAKICLTYCEMRKLLLQPTNMAEQLSWRTGSWDFFLTDMTSQGIRQHFFFWLTPTQTKTLAAMKATLKTAMPMTIPGNKIKGKVWAKGTLPRVSNNLWENKIKLPWATEPRLSVTREAMLLTKRQRYHK